MALCKSSLNYFTIDTDRYQDRRIKRLKKAYSCDGIAVYDYLLCEIYRDRGCYIELDEDLIFDVAEYWDIDEERVKEIVEYCASIGLFSEGMLSKKSILTSASIQRRYIEMSARAKRKDSKIPEEYNILTEESPIIPEQFEKITEESQQNKIKKSKVNKNTLSISPSSGESESGSHPLTEEEREIITSIFFWRNIKDFKQEAERFFNHYSATGWTRKGEPIKDKVALARTWDPKEKSLLLPTSLMNLWVAITNTIDPSDNTSEFVYDLHNIEVVDQTIYFYGTQRLMDILTSHEGAIMSAIHNQKMKIYNYRYRVPRQS